MIKNDVEISVLFSNMGPPQLGTSTNSTRKFIAVPFSMIVPFQEKGTVLKKALFYFSNIFKRVPL